MMAAGTEPPGTSGAVESWASWKVESVALPSGTGVATSSSRLFWPPGSAVS